jgi:hypothetical protein
MSASCQANVFPIHVWRAASTKYRSFGQHTAARAIERHGRQAANGVRPASWRSAHKGAMVAPARTAWPRYLICPLTRSVRSASLVGALFFAGHGVFRSASTRRAAATRAVANIGRRRRRRQRPAAHPRACAFEQSSRWVLKMKDWSLQIRLMAVAQTHRRTLPPLGTASVDAVPSAYSVASNVSNQPSSRPQRVGKGREVCTHRSILANSHSRLQSGHTERDESQRWMQSRWNTCPHVPQAMLRPG